jgi:hypothetical protein
LALEGKFITKPKQGWYALVNQETGEITGKNYRGSEIVDNADIWKNLISETSFPDWIKNKYSLGTIGMIRDDSNADEE